MLEIFNSDLFIISFSKGPHSGNNLEVYNTHHETANVFSFFLQERNFLYCIRVSWASPSDSARETRVITSKSGEWNYRHRVLLTPMLVSTEQPLLTLHICPRFRF
jgi:hypothetical protein